MIGAAYSVAVRAEQAFVPGLLHYYLQPVSGFVSHETSTCGVKSNLIACANKMKYGHTFPPEGIKCNADNLREVFRV